MHVEYDIAQTSLTKILALLEANAEVVDEARKVSNDLLMCFYFHTSEFGVEPAEYWFLYFQIHASSNGADAFWYS